MPRPRTARTAVPALLLAGLGLVGCTTQQEANDNAPQPQPSQPQVTREPVPVESAPATVPEVPAENSASESPASPS